MGKFNDYEAYYTKYRGLYGDKTAVFYQIGKFHEIYGVNNEHEKVGNVEDIVSLLNIKLTRCNTAIAENNRSNPLMAGFNSVALDSNVERLVSCGYTVVVVDQVGVDETTGNVLRDVTFIHSPGTTTTINTNMNRDPYIVSIHTTTEKHRQSGQEFLYIGMVASDITTGYTCWFESNSNYSDPTLAMDDLTRFFQTFCPVEVIMPGSTESMVEKWDFRLATTTDTEEESSGFLDLLNNAKPVVFQRSPFDGTKVNPLLVEHQEQFLSSFFPSTTPSSVHEHLGLERAPMATVAYMNLLKFCHDHNKALMSNLEPPASWGSDHTNLVLDTSSINQLAIMSPESGRSSLFNLLRANMQTVMGCRLLRDRLLTPTTDKQTLKERYDQVEAMLENNRHQEVHRILHGVRDMDRLHRKLVVGSITPYELTLLWETYEKVVVFDETKVFTETLLQRLKTTFDREACSSKTHLDQVQESLFIVGVDSMVDELQKKLDTINANCSEALVNKFNTLLSSQSAVKYKEDNDGGCYLTMSKPQYTKLQKIADLSEFTIDTRNKSNVKLRSEGLTMALREQKTVLVQLKKAVLTRFKEEVSTLGALNAELNALSRDIALIDLNHGIARRSAKMSYTRPSFTDEQGTACLAAVGLRHPLVEARYSYVAQTISLGGNGLLLYGVNQSGKSCTMKSVGIAIVMAQAGFFVPATSFTFSPYTTLMTRILGNDNLDKGLSAYAVEMMELRSILTRCTANTLVLGDELCHGTESASAVSLVAASIEHLSRIKASFIFATHLHELSSMPEITGLDNVAQKHLTVSFEGNRIIYNRLMQPGSGKGLYGIEVAQHLRLPTTVVERAVTLRNKYFDDSARHNFKSKTSRYNSNVLLMECKILECKKAGEHTHHIRFQSEADEQGFVKPGMHKNHRQNLVTLCEEHHTHVHQGTKDGKKVLVIFGYTDEGSLHYEYRPLLSSLL